MATFPLQVFNWNFTINFYCLFSVSSAASATNGPVMYNHHGAAGVPAPGNHNPHHPAAAAHHAHQYSTTTPPPVVQAGGAPAAAGQQRPPYYSLPPNGAGGRMPHQGGPRMPLGPRMNQPPPSAGGNGTSHPPPHPHQQPPTYAQIPSQLHHGMYPQQVPQLILHHHAYPVSHTISQTKMLTVAVHFVVV